MKPRGSRTYRFLILVPCALAAGFVVTVITAAACTSGEPGSVTNAVVVGEGRTAWSVIYSKGRGQSKAVISFHPDKARADTAVALLKGSLNKTSGLRYDQTLTVPDWCAAMARDAETTLKPTSLTGISGSAFCAGWPINCFYGGTFFSATLSGSATTNIGAREFGRRLVPTTPRPLPLALNTMFFAVVVGGLFPLAAMTARSLRARRMRRLGRCIDCGYDLHGLTAETACPECGAIPPSSAK